MISALTGVVAKANDDNVKNAGKDLNVPAPMPDSTPSQSSVKNVTDPPIGAPIDVRGTVIPNGSVVADSSGVQHQIKVVNGRLIRKNLTTNEEVEITPNGPQR
jgi:hypothetical protein